MLLSIVIATAQPWPELRMTLDSLFGQATACGAEIIVADGTGGYGLPGDVQRRYPGLVWLRPPARSVFALRAAGMAAASGDVVATTEDHCSLAPDWCASILRAHGAHADAGVVGGPVDTGLADSLKDWAHHFLVFGPAVPPIDRERPGPMWCAANVAYKRRVLASATSRALPVEMFLLRDLQAAGVRFVADSSMVVRHHQSFALSAFCYYHFHNGRTIAAVRAARLGWPGRLARMMACGILPLYLVGLRWSQIWRKPSRRATLVRCLPWMAGLSTAHALGELVGTVAGAGSSPGRLR